MRTIMGWNRYGREIMTDLRQYCLYVCIYKFDFWLVEVPSKIDKIHYVFLLYTHMPL